MLGYGVVFILLILSASHLIKWRKKRKALGGLPGIKPLPLVGSVRDLPATLMLGKLKLHPLVRLWQVLQGWSLIYCKEKLFQVWLGPKPTVVIFGAEYVEAVLKSNTQIEKGDFYHLVDAWLGDGLLTSGGTKWRQHRKILTPSFHFRILDQFLSVMNEQSVVLVNKIKNSSGQKKWINIHEYMSMFAFDVICETAMGVRIGAQGNSDSPYLKALNKFTELSATRLTNPFLYTDFVFFLTSLAATYKKTLGTMIQFTKSVIAERLSSQKKKEDGFHGQDSKRLAFLDMLLEHYGTNFDTDDIREHVDSFMFANVFVDVLLPHYYAIYFEYQTGRCFQGHETTSVALSFTLFLLGHHPEIQNRIHQELDGVFQGDKERDVTNEDLKQMKYLECVIKESQRLYSPVPLISRQLVEDITLGQHVIPKGIEIIISVQALHQDPEVYPTPEAFKPDRFSPENSSGRHPFAFVPFSAGPRNCIGQRFALMEEKVLLCHILRHYRIYSKDQKDTVHLMPVGVLRSEGPLLLRFQEKELASH